ncbi:MAG TPA: O-acetyl-ADP-ribose deacetylase [Pyrinomonadaceae bacterium]|nr:O-acetyl-ADP-ribose deacetylase [Pyrinomonadaceae bacterium]
MKKTDATFLDGRVVVVVGDITSLDVDAIVNAANATLLGGGGVDGAIHRIGGPAILAACREIRRTQYPQGLPTGEAVITTGGNLPARHVIHTVGPIYGRHDGQEAQLLKACYQNSLTLASQHGLTSIAFPAISTGAFGYPQPEAAQLASEIIKSYVLTDDQIREVRLVFFQVSSAEIFLEYQKFGGRSDSKRS